MGFVREPRDYSCIGALLAVVVPFALTAALSAVPVSWVPSPVGYGRASAIAILLIGSAGILVQPWSGTMRVLAILVYVPLMFIVLAMFALVSGCFIQGGAACP